MNTAEENYEKCFLYHNNCDKYPQCEHVVYCTCCDTYINKYLVLTAPCYYCQLEVCDLCFETVEYVSNNGSEWIYVCKDCTNNRIKG